MELRILYIALLLVLIPVSINTHSIPITRHPSSQQQASGCTSVGPNNQTVLGFGNCFNNIYYININIGTPPQTLGVQFDTGSNILWVPTQSVTGVTPIFNTTKSSTFTNTSQTGGVQYVDGSGVSGTYGSDVFQISNSLINIVTQYLWVTSENQMNFPSNIQGLVGMGYTTTPNFLDVAYNKGEISTSAFALQILNQGQNSVIYYNQIPEQITNSTIFVPVYGSTYWQVEVFGVSVGGIDMTDSAAQNAVIDSGTSYFYLNPTLFNSVVNQFFSDCIQISGVPTCSCSNTNNWPTFEFSFEGVQVSIEASQYTQNISSGICTYLFGSISGISQLLLGDIFFRAYIVTFDKLNSQIGFSGNNIVPLPVISSDTNDIIGWILLGILGVLVLFGFGVSCSLDKGIGDTSKGVFNPQMELSNSARLRAPLY